MTKLDLNPENPEVVCEMLNRMGKRFVIEHHHVPLESRYFRSEYRKCLDEAVRFHKENGIDAIHEDVKHQWNNEFAFSPIFRYYTAKNGKIYFEDESHTGIGRYEITIKQKRDKYGTGKMSWVCYGVVNKDNYKHRSQSDDHFGVDPIEAFSNFLIAKADGNC
jgi:hypothetical protein